MHKTALAQAVGEDDLDRADQPCRAVGDHQQRRAQAPVHQLAQEACPGVMALAGARRQPDQHRAALAGDPQAASTGSAGAPGCMRKWEPSKNRYSSSTSCRSRCFQASNSSLIAWQMRLTVDFERAASGPSASARAASTSRTDRPRTNPDTTSASSASVHALAEQPGRERLGGTAQLGPLQHHRPSGGLHRQLGVAIAIPDAVTVAAGVTVPAEELADLGFHGGLHDQPHAQSGDLLQDLTKSLLGGEQLVDLGADALGSR
jgi:hypothetical protein